jgi:hypothetical protein
MVRLIGAIPRVQELLGDPVIVGGLAVMCRLRHTHRVTEDLDALHRRLAGAASGLELLSAAGAIGMNEVGGSIATDRGLVRVDVLEAHVGDLDREFTDATDRLEAAAHHWTLQTATPVLIRAEADLLALESSQEVCEATALVARPGPLVAMKLKASVDRTSAKTATDLLDVVRLVTDPNTAEAVLNEFDQGDAQLRADVALHAELQFRTQRRRTHQLIRNLGSQTPDETLIDAAADFLDGMLKD